MTTDRDNRSLSDSWEPKRRLRSVMRSWPMHNLVAHPLSEIMHWLGLTVTGDRLHDATLPEHEAGTGRG